MTKTITSLRAVGAVMKYASGSRTCSQLSIATRLKCHPTFTIQDHGGILLPMRHACRSYQSIVKEVIAIHAASRPIAPSIKAKRQMRFGPRTLISKSNSRNYSQERHIMQKRQLQELCSLALVSVYTIPDHRPINFNSESQHEI